MRAAVRQANVRTTVGRGPTSASSALPVWCGLPSTCRFGRRRPATVCPLETYGNMPHTSRQRDPNPSPEFACGIMLGTSQRFSLTPASQRWNRGATTLPPPAPAAAAPVGAARLLPRWPILLRARPDLRREHGRSRGPGVVRGLRRARRGCAPNAQGASATPVPLATQRAARAAKGIHALRAARRGQWARHSRAARVNGPRPYASSACACAATGSRTVPCGAAGCLHDEGRGAN